MNFKETSRSLFMLIKWFPHIMLLCRKEALGDLAPDLEMGGVAAQVNPQRRHSVWDPSAPALSPTGQRPTPMSSVTIESPFTPMIVDHQRSNEGKKKLCGK